MGDTSAFRRFFESGEPAMVVTIAAAKGSTPREEGAVMAVSAAGICGTIGGGQLEYIAIDHARGFLQGKENRATLDIPLGSEIGQCCGGRTVLSFKPANEAVTAELLETLERRKAGEPSVYIFGGGHVGAALAHALAPLPFNTTLVETRKDTVKDMPADISLRLTPMPEADVARMPAGAAAVIVTHDHALDFLIAAQALKRRDLAYCGMIGSATKRATFRRFAAKEGLSADDLERLTMPIGGQTVKDKRPSVIGALVVSELIFSIHAFQTGRLPLEQAIRHQTSI